MTVRNTRSDTIIYLFQPIALVAISKQFTSKLHFVEWLHVWLTIFRYFDKISNRYKTNIRTNSGFLSFVFWSFAIVHTSNHLFVLYFSYCTIFNFPLIIVIPLGKLSLIHIKSQPANQFHRITSTGYQNKYALYRTIFSSNYFQILHKFR